MRRRLGPLLLLLVCLAPPGLAWEQDGAYRYTGVDRVVAVGDVHGAHGELVAVLRRARLIDDQDRWIGGDDHLVSVGDLLDRGDDSRAVMDLLMRLQAEAEAAGGRVHVVLGNHEVMNLTGDLGYVTPGEFASYLDLVPEGATGAADLPPGFLGHQRAFSPDGPYGRWLLDLPFAVVVNGTLYVHAGISGVLDGLSLDAVNARAHADLRRLIDARAGLVAIGAMTPEADNGRAQAAALRIRENELAEAAHRAAAEEFLAAIDGLPFIPLGPVWNRRNAVCHPLFQAPATREQLAALGAERLVVGHTPTLGRTIQSRFDTTLLLVDTGMNVAYYDGHPSALVAEGGTLRPVYTDLELDTVVAQSARQWERPWGMSDAEIEAFLREGEIVEVEDLAVGVTKPQRLTLRRGDREIRAVYKNFDSDPDLGPNRWQNRRGDRADRFVYDVAAYRLDRILGLELVPPAVLREVDGRLGVVQYWLENAVNEKSRREENLAYRGICSLGDQYALMNLFDALIHNDDRNLSNVLYTRPDWKLWLIDHTRAFRSDSRLPQFREESPYVFTPAIVAMLERIDEAALAPLGEYLHDRQLPAIERRAERLRDLAD